MVNVLSSYFNDPSSNPAECYICGLSYKDSFIVTYDSRLMGNFPVSNISICTAFINFATVYFAEVDAFGLWLVVATLSGNYAKAAKYRVLQLVSLQCRFPWST